MLKFNNRKLNDIAFVIGDNCNTNKKLSKLLKVPLLGCYSHRLNLAIRLMIDTKYKEVVQKVHDLCIKLRTSKMKGWLVNKKCNWVSIINSETRWDSDFKMIKRYIQLRPFIRVNPHPDFADELLNVRLDRCVDELIRILEDLYSVSLQLQKDDISIAKARIYIEEAIELYPILSSHIDTDSAIVYSPSFESGILKLQNNDESSLNPSEKMAIKSLELRVSPTVGIVSADESESSDNELNLVQRVNKRMKLELHYNSKYINVKGIAPTSHCVKRLFSQCKQVITGRRNRLLPTIFEMIMFLKLNMHVWDINTVQRSLALVDDEDMLLGEEEE